MQDSKIILYFLLMLVTGLSIYYLYLNNNSDSYNNSITQIENFDPTTTAPIPTCPPPETSIYNSITSRYYGVGFNIYPIKSADNNVCLIEHLPTIYSNTPIGSMYACTESGQLTIKPRNDSDTSQYWIVTAYVDVVDNKPSDTISFVTVKPYITNSDTLALSYENGSLALRTFNINFESQKWLLTKDKITKGIPVLNYNPATLFTSEFDPYSSITVGSNAGTTSLDDQNNRQITEVLNQVKTGIQQFLAQSSKTQSSTGQVTSSSFGNRDNPINVSVSLSPSTNSKSNFINVGDSPDTVLSLLDKYESAQNENPSLKTFYSVSDLQRAVDSNENCKSVNLDDYTSRRVSTCNCKL